ncbi:MAG: hypothetical protein JWO51_3125 [Rhodospirillales bacterium]|nr:hypothetical protein [Rhodospirillales bacterium]
MSIKWTMIFLMIASALIMGPAFAAKFPADLAKAAKEYDQAQINGDRAELERLLADDYVLVNSPTRSRSRSSGSGPMVPSWVASSTCPARTAVNDSKPRSGSPMSGPSAKASGG